MVQMMIKQIKLIYILFALLFTVPSMRAYRPNNETYTMPRRAQLSKGETYVITATIVVVGSLLFYALLEKRKREEARRKQEEVRRKQEEERAKIAVISRVLCQLGALVRKKWYISNQSLRRGWR